MGGLRVLFTAADIAARVDTLAMEMAGAMPADFVIVGLLKSAAVFVADLARALDHAGARPEIEFIRLSSYGFATASSGVVQLHGDIPAGLTGRPVLLVDDIVDTGRSIAYAAAQLHRRGISGLWTCALLDKPQRREIKVTIDFVGFSIGMYSSLAMAPTTPKSTAICLISASWGDEPSLRLQRRPNSTW